MLVDTVSAFCWTRARHAATAALGCPVHRGGPPSYHFAWWDAPQEATWRSRTPGGRYGRLIPRFGPLRCNPLWSMIPCHPLLSAGVPSAPSGGILSRQYRVHRGPCTPVVTLSLFLKSETLPRRTYPSPSGEFVNNPEISAGGQHQTRLVDPHQLSVTVCHYPAGASKWKPHRPSPVQRDQQKLGRRPAARLRHHPQPHPYLHHTDRTPRGRPLG